MPTPGQSRTESDLYTPGSGPETTALPTIFDGMVEHTGPAVTVIEGNGGGRSLTGGAGR